MPTRYVGLFCPNGHFNVQDTYEVERVNAPLLLHWIVNRRTELQCKKCGSTVSCQQSDDVGRPVQGQPNSKIGLFRVLNGGAEAIRVSVELGRTSVNSVEVLRGLQAGDHVVLSDMSAWDAYDHIRLE